LRIELAPLIEKKVVQHYPMSLFIALLRAQVLDLMENLTLSEDAILQIVTDRKFLTDLGRLSAKDA
jgi:hypothetical protein